MSSYPLISFSVVTSLLISLSKTYLTSVTEFLTSGVCISLLKLTTYSCILSTLLLNALIYFKFSGNSKLLFHIQVCFIFPDCVFFTFHHALRFFLLLLKATLLLLLLSHFSCVQLCATP